MSKQKRETKTPKGEQTRILILNAALDLLAERGYEKTTMRAIADKAGVSLGNAYHYFKSKEHLVQAFYHRTHTEHLAASAPIFEKETSLKGRLLDVLRLKIKTLEPYHEFAGGVEGGIALPAVALPHGDNSVLDTRQIAQTRAYILRNRSHSGSPRSIDHTCQ